MAITLPSMSKGSIKLLSLSLNLPSRSDLRSGATSKVVAGELELADRQE